LQKRLGITFTVVGHTQLEPVAITDKVATATVNY